MKKRLISAILVIAIFVCMIPASFITVNAAVTNITRDDGVWLFPLDKELWNSWSDWAGCNSSQSTGICPFHRYHCYYCSASHNTGDYGYGHNGVDLGA